MHNLNNDIKKILITKEQILNRCEELGKQIDNDYQDKEPVLLALLKGSMQFLSTLGEYITIPCVEDFMKVSSYAGTTSTGNVVVKTHPSVNLKGRHVIIVEDIIDTGLTLHTVVEILKELEPESIEIITLLDKPYMRKCKDICPKYVGFEVPNEFVVGYGLDYDELYRQLPYVGVLKEEVYNK